MIKEDLENILQKAEMPISVFDILSKVKANKTTIYRAIDKLLSEGIISEVDFGDRIKRYELKSLEHHHHLICLHCKKITDVNIEEKFNVPENFKVVKHNLEFFGFCVNCQ